MKSTRTMVETSLLVALSVVLFLASHFLPVIGIIISFFCPVPLVILGLKEPVQNAFTGAFVAFVLTTFVLGLLGGFFFLFGFALMGVSLGVLGRRFEKVSDILSYGFLISLSCKLVLMALVKLLTGMNPFAIDPDTLMESFNNVMGVLSGSHGEAFLETMRMQFETMSRIMVHILPAILMAASFLDCVISYVISEKIARRFRIVFLPGMPPFGEWRFPKSTLFAFFIALVLSFFGRSGNNIGVLYVVGLNLKVISMMIFLIQGLATVWYLLSKLSKDNMKRWVGILVVVMIIFVPILSMAVIMLGFLDILVDLRSKFWR